MADLEDDELDEQPRIAPPTRPSAPGLPPVTAPGLGSATPEAGGTEDLEARGIASHLAPRGPIVTAPEKGSTEDLEQRGFESRIAPPSALTPPDIASPTRAHSRTIRSMWGDTANIESKPLRVLGRIGVGALGALDVAGGGPLEKAAQAQKEQDLKDQGTQAATAEAGARTDQATAAAEKDRAAAATAGQPKAKEEKWDLFAGFTDTDGTPLIREENSGQVVRASDKKPPTGFHQIKPAAGPKTEKVTRVVNGVPHEVLVNAETGEDVKDEGQTKVPGESPESKRNAAESAQVEREARQSIRKAEGQYRATQQSVNQLSASIDQAKDGNGLLTSFVPTMEVLGINASNGVHRISPAEAQAAGLPGGWVERFNAWFDKATTGKLSPELQQEGKALGKILADSAYQRYKSTYDDESGIVSGYGGTDFGKRVPLIPGTEPSTGGAAGGGPPKGATMKVPGSDGHLHWSDGKQDLGVVQ